jgi:omega-6 fatty acid desaturase (delta-12 desaturase)
MDTSSSSASHNRKELLKKWYRLANEGPSTAEVLAVLPPHLYEKSLLRSLSHAAMSVALTVGTFMLAYWYLPVSASYIPLWVLYAVVCGTIATGCWVIAHECGHNAFCDQLWLQDAVGYVLHSAMLVPYYSWQRSHAVHHSRTNHLTEGETHVPNPTDSHPGKRALFLHQLLGDDAFAVYSVFMHLALGWPRTCWRVRRAGRCAVGRTTLCRLSRSRTRCSTRTS